MFSECVGVGGPASRWGVSPPLRGEAPLLHGGGPTPGPPPPAPHPDKATWTTLCIDAVPTMRGNAAANNEPLYWNNWNIFKENFFVIHNKSNTFRILHLIWTLSPRDYSGRVLWNNYYGIKQNFLSILLIVCTHICMYIHTYISWVLYSETLVV